MIAYVDQYDNTYTEEEALKLLADAVLGEETDEELVTLEEALDDGRVVNVWTNGDDITEWGLSVSREGLVLGPTDTFGDGVAITKDRIAVGIRVNPDTVAENLLEDGQDIALLSLSFEDAVTVMAVIQEYLPYVNDVPPTTPMFEWIPCDG